MQETMPAHHIHIENQDILPQSNFEIINNGIRIW